MKIIGIDPGLNGAIAILENNKVLNVFLICQQWPRAKKIKNN